MRTSRVSQETAKITKHLSSNTISTRRQTRSFVASLNAYATSASLKTDVAIEAKREDNSDDESDLTSASLGETGDIEDTIAPSFSSRKRKRGADTPATTVTSISSSTTERLSPRKGEIKSEDSGNGKIKKVRRQPAKKVINGEVKIHPPDNWAEIYSAVTEMRKRVLAPVDTMGCETLAEEQASPRVCSVNPSGDAEILTSY